jgi:signal transduction histidine kinase
MDFIRATSHALDIPLKTFLDYGKRLADDFNVQRSSTLLRYATSIYTSAVQLKEIVQDIVQITAIESGTLVLRLQAVLLDALLQQVHRELQVALQKRHLELKLADLAFTIEADQEHLHLVFEKLVENAIKYTPNGGHITIHAERHSTAGEAAESVEIVISDTGIGIKPELQEMVFTPFFHTGKMSLSPQASKTDFKAVGPGLGLAIARGIIQAHGGRIWVESPGYDEFTYPGSRFHVVLPLR